MKNSDGVNWNLKEIGSFEELYGEIEKEIERVDWYFEKLSPEMSIAEFKEFIEWDQNLSDKVARLAYLPELMESIDQKDSQARLMKSKVNNLILKLSQKSRKITHWLKGLEVKEKKSLDLKNSQRLFASVPDLEYVLNYSREAAKHTLSEREEEIVENKDVNGVAAISDIRGLIESEMVYEMGKKKIKTQGELLKNIHDKSAIIRRMAYKALFDKHAENIDKLFVIYQAIVKDWAFEAQIRGYKSAISMRNFANHVSDKSVETLLEVCKQEKEVFWKYFEYKAKMMKTGKLNRFDLYAPLLVGRQKSESIKYDGAKKMVIESFFHFSDKFAEYGKRVIDEQHIDSHPKAGKRSGAFCATIGPRISPYVLLNYTGTTRDVSTLAHELGHAIHSLYANKHYPASQHANLPLSETASTLAEMVLFEEMLNKENDPMIKKQMLWDKIGETYATVLRQNYFVMFEIEAHKLITKGATAKELCKLYLNNLRDQFGNSMKVETIFQYEWLYISHIFESPFYCYAYNFGELLSLSLYSRYKSEGKSFVSRIEKLLETGGSKDPTEALKEIGVDVESADFWRGGFELIRQWQKQLEAI